MYNILYIEMSQSLMDCIYAIHSTLHCRFEFHIMVFIFSASLTRLLSHLLTHIPILTHILTHSLRPSNVEICE